MNRAIEILLGEGFALHQLNKYHEASQKYGSVLKVSPKNFDALHLLGILYLQTGEIDKALMSLENASKINPANVSAVMHYGSALAQSGQIDDAIICFERALALQPNDPMVWYSLGLACADKKDYLKSKQCFEQAVLFNPNFYQGWANLGNVLIKLHEDANALSVFEKIIEAIGLEPNVLLGKSTALYELKRFEDALACVEALINLAPIMPQAYDNKGMILVGLGRFELAQEAYRHAIKIDPEFYGALNHLGCMYADQKRFEEGIKIFSSILSREFYDADAHNNLGRIFLELRKFDLAEDELKLSLEANPQLFDANVNYAFLLEKQGRLVEALRFYKNCHAIDSGKKWILGYLFHNAAKRCDWSRYDELFKSIKENIHNNYYTSTPFIFLGADFSLIEQLICSRLYAKERIDFVKNKERIVIKVPSGKIKIAYLSSDYYGHATAYLMAEIFELHDRNQFETFGICYKESPSDPMRDRIRSAFDHFIEVAGKSDQEIAALMNALEIDIAVDLKGHTENARLGIFAYRAAPVQVHYLGYPGTLGTEFIDYLIADPVLVPEEHRQYYSEKIVYLPETYQCNDRSRVISDDAGSRSDHGLPEDAFVFCCFNNNWKISPDVFDCWARILKRVDNSVLWLLRDNETASNNLLKEAVSRGIDPDRLVFADRAPLDQHLARHRHADLFLDTLYYNAHTTASDALWAGLPVLTRMGETYASRVASSLLTAIDLPELITHSIEDYERLAIELAETPKTLKAIQLKLAHNRLKTSLFDSPRFTKHLENAYEQMLCRYRAGLAPDHIEVKPLPTSFSQLN